ncbi:MAG: ABC transporter substrate-binding protein [Oscillospiraceae bacterium]|jgi:branched-chain amino acid transport system substrate-binding protein|nr:ABC transporter substrate-binding protein [Oscillospiraceae bacterium]
MKNQLKRLLALLTAVVLCVALFAACTPAEDSAKTETPSDGESVDGGVTDDGGSTAVEPFKIGGTGPLTGGAAIYGNAAKNGAEIAVEEINALGGDIQFELNYQDDEHDAEKAVNAYNALKDWGMQLFLGSVTSTPGVATSAESNEDRIIFLTPSASSTEVLGGFADPLTGIVSTARKDNVFQMCFVDPNQGSASAQYIVDKGLASKVAVIYKNDDVYSMGIYNSFKVKAEELGLEIVSATTFTEGSQNDFNVQLTEAKNGGAELIFLPMYYTPASLIFAQAKAMDYTPKFFGVDGMDGILTMDGFDTALAEGVMLLTPFNADSTDSLTTSFVAKYYEKYGEIPNQFAADGYDCVYAYYYALQYWGGYHTADGSLMSAAELCENLIAVFTDNAFSFDGVTGSGMQWDATGAVTKEPKGMVIENGAYIGID